MTLLQIVMATRAPGSVILIRLLAAVILIGQAALILSTAFGATYGIAQTFVEMGGPWRVAVELLCGVLIALGLLTRIASFFALFDSLVVLFMMIPALLDQGFLAGIYGSRGEFAVAMASLFLILIGGGRLSLDHYLGGAPLEPHDPNVIRPPGTWTTRQYEKSQQRE